MELTILSKGREAVKSFRINLRGLEMKKRKLYPNAAKVKGAAYPRRPRVKP